MQFLKNKNEKLHIYTDKHLSTLVIDIEGSFSKPRGASIRNNKIFVNSNDLNITKIICKKHCSSKFLKDAIPEVFNEKYVEFLKNKKIIFNTLVRVFGEDEAKKFFYKFIIAK